MKSKKSKAILLLGITVPMTLMAGCSLDTVREVAQEVQNEKVQKIEAEKLSLEEYTKEATRIRSEFNVAVKELGELRQDSETDRSEWRVKYIEKIVETQTILNQFKTIAPSGELKDKMGDEMNKAVDEFNEGFTLFELAAEKGDTDIDTEGTEHIAKGQEYWNYAFRVLSVNNPLPVEGSDGTIDSQDLKNLDANVGIDRDSVVMNVSKDGKELVGKWGFYNEDGTPNVSIVLHEDGKYEGYGNGAYPSKENYFDGRWEWNYLKGTVDFYNDVAYKNGVKQEANRAKMPFELQRYDEKGIQLFDLESFATFGYEKIDGEQKSVKIPTKSVTVDTSRSTQKPSSTSSQVNLSLSDLEGYWLTDDKNVVLSLKENGTFYMDIENPEHRIYTGSYEYDKGAKNLVLNVDEVKAEVLGQPLKGEKMKFDFNVQSFSNGVLNMTESGDEWKLNYDGKI